MSSRIMEWLLLLVGVICILTACKLADPAVLKQLTAPSPSPTPSPIPTNTPLPPTAAPSPTPVPSETPLPPTLAPTATLIPTQPPAPSAPTQGPSNANETSAHVKITNGLGVGIKIVMTGPSTRSFNVFGLGKLEVDLVPGTYNYTITMTGYYPINGTHTFVAGNNTWTIGK